MIVRRYEEIDFSYILRPSCQMLPLRLRKRRTVLFRCEDFIDLSNNPVPFLYRMVFFGIQINGLEKTLDSFSMSCTNLFQEFLLR